MKLEEIKKTIENIKRGKYTRITYQSETPRNGNIYLKITTMVVRLGIEYKNTNYAKQKDTTGSLKGKTWVTYGYILQGKTDLLLRVYNSFSPKHRAKSKYYCNGKEITKEEYNDGVKKTSSNNIIPCFDIKIKNVIALG